MKHKFKLPIGDWSGDGHGKADWYIIESNLPPEEVRALYFQACEKLGFTLDGHHALTPASEYQEVGFSEEALDRLIEFGVPIDEVDQEYIREEGYAEMELFLDIILELIKTQDSFLTLEVVDDGLEMLQFYGYNGDGKHIGFFGYGYFD